MIDEQHEHDLIQLINKQIQQELEEEKPSLLDKIAHFISKFSGGWFFLIFLACFLSTWIFLNTLINNTTFDPYPFILLNLFLSFLSIFQNVIIAMTQNRDSIIDRKREKRAYIINMKSELEIKELHKKIDNIFKITQ
jgi:uncharacterized membrane protein